MLWEQGEQAGSEGSKLGARGVSWGLPEALGGLEPRKALGGLGPWERAGVNWSLWEASGGLGRPLALGASWSEPEPREALGASWSELEPWEALGGLRPWERAGANWSLGRPRALGASWSELEPWEALGGLGPWE